MVCACVCAYTGLCVFKGAIGKTEPSRGEGAGFPSPIALVIPHALLHVETISGKIQTQQPEMTERHLHIKAYEQGCKTLNLIGDTALSSINLCHSLAVIREGYRPLSEEYDLIDKRFHIHRVAC